MTKHTSTPWFVELDDTGGEYTGWPSIVAAEKLDLTIIHRAGFKHQFWGETSERVAVANALFTVRAVNSHDDLLAACREFCRKVEAGDAKSVRSYAQMKAAIAKAETNEDQRP